MWMLIPVCCSQSMLTPKQHSQVTINHCYVSSPCTSKEYRAQLAPSAATTHDHQDEASWLLRHHHQVVDSSYHRRSSSSSALGRTPLPSWGMLSHQNHQSPSAVRWQQQVQPANTSSMQMPIETSTSMVQYYKIRLSQCRKSENHKQNANLWPVLIVHVQDWQVLVWSVHIQSLATVLTFSQLPFTMYLFLIKRNPVIIHLVIIHRVHWNHMPVCVWHSPL